MPLADYPEIQALSTEEKLRLVEELWNDVASNPEVVPVPEWIKEELDRRKAAHEADPSSARTWEEVKAHARTAHSNAG